jgi:hypothetical protein
MGIMPMLLHAYYQTLNLAKLKALSTATYLTACMIPVEKEIHHHE